MALPYNPYYNNTPVNSFNAYPTYPYQQQAAPQQPITQGNSIIWVQGLEGAKSYNVAPNNTVALWDSENTVIYMKSADSMGKPTIKYLDYAVRDEVKEPTDYVSKTEFSKLSSQLADLSNQLKQLKNNRKQKEE